MSRIKQPRSVPSARAKSFRIFAAILLASATIVTAASANDDLERAKEASKRMKARQAQVDQILKDQKAGERNDGLLEPMSELTPETSKLITEENRDREAIFSGIARASVTPISEIKKRRADWLRDRLVPGVYRMVPTDDAKWEWSVGQGIQKSPVIEIEDDTLRFTPTRIGAPNHSRVTVRNAGKGKLIIHSATAEPSVFTVEMEEAPIIVERGETADITVVFRPVEGAPTEGKLVIASNDQNAGDQEIELIGNVAISTEDAIKVFDGLDSSSTVLEPK
jgi:uncharacterized protein YdbL (DUF1318 family)